MEKSTYMFILVVTLVIGTMIFIAFVSGCQNYLNRFITTENNPIHDDVY